MSADDRGFRRRGPLGKRVLSATAEHALLLVFVAISVAPLYVMLVTSVQDPAGGDVGRLVPGGQPEVDNYGTVWNQLRFKDMFANSAILAVGSSAVTTLLAAMAAFALARLRFAGRAALTAAIVALMATPAIVVILPLAAIFNDLRLTNTYAGGILAEVGLLLPFAVALVYTYMRELPGELFEAAEVDGASSFRQCFLLAIPLSRSALVTTAILCAVFAWNDLLVPLVIWSTEQFQTLMVGLSVLGPSRTGVQELPLLMAGVAVSVLPLALLFAFSRRLIIAGLTEGADR